MSEDNKRIVEFDFLRICAAFMIFVNHVWAFLPFKIPDFGARGVEIFFLLSGFLMFHNYKDRAVETSFFACLKFGIRKIRPYYFLHIITMLCMVYLYSEQEGFAYLKSNILPIATNIMLLQSWIPIQTVYFGGNGVSWFLSSIFFCYCVFPLILKRIKTINSNENLLFVACTALVFLALLQGIYKGSEFYSYGYVFHVFPLYGLTLFIIGMLLASVFERVSYIDGYLPVANNKLFICIGGGYALSVFLCNQAWPKCMFIFFEIILIYALARYSGGKSIFSLFCSRKIISRLSAMTFDFYLIHHVVILYYWKMHPFFLKVMGREFGWKGQVFFIFSTSFVLSSISFLIRKNIQKYIKAKSLQEHSK